MALMAGPLPSAAVGRRETRWPTLISGLALSIALHATAAAAFFGLGRFSQPPVPYAIEITVVTGLPGGQADNRDERGETSLSRSPLPSAGADPLPAKPATPAKTPVAAVEPAEESDPPLATPSPITLPAENAAPPSVGDMPAAASPVRQPVLKPDGWSFEAASQNVGGSMAPAAAAPYDGTARPVGDADATMADMSGRGGDREASPDAGNPIPDYPRLARRRGIEGEVLLRVLVDIDGRPSAVAVAESSGYDVLDAAAREAVEKWRFQPARRLGSAVEATVMVPIVFRLEN